MAKDRISSPKVNKAKRTGTAPARTHKAGPSPIPAIPVSAAICLFVAFCGAAYLAGVSLNNGSVAGCGPGSGCNQVLSSRWGYWLGIPVSLPALAAYASLLGASWLSRSTNPPRQVVGWRIILVLAPVIPGAALWFLVIQATVLHAWCKYCLATHFFGSLGSVLLLLDVRRSGSWPAAVRTRERGWSVLGAGLALAALFGGQVLVQPRLYRTSLLPGNNYLKPQVVSLYHGTISLSPTQLPVRGTSSATNFIVSLFDYTCRHCRALHPLLKAAEQKYQGRLGIISLPMPLDAACNSLIRATSPANQNACEYAKLSLAVWRVRREAFSEFDDWMFEGPQVPPLEQARARAQALVGKEALDHALADPWVSEQLQRDIHLYESNSRATRDGRLPQLVIGDVVTHGAMARLDDLVGLLEKNTGLGALH